MQQNKQNKVVNLLDTLPAEDIDKILEHNSSKGSIDEEWMILGRFGAAFGYDEYKAAVNDEVTLQEVMILLEAKDKLDMAQMYRDAQAAFIGAAAANSKKPGSTFRKLTKEIVNKLKVG